jgi:hypothetical protein
VLLGAAGNDEGGGGNGAGGGAVTADVGVVEDEEVGDDVLGTVCPAVFEIVIGLLFAVI